MHYPVLAGKTAVRHKNAHRRGGQIEPNQPLEYHSLTTKRVNHNTGAKSWPHRYYGGKLLCVDSAVNRQ